MTDTQKRDAVLARHSANGWNYPDHEAMADRIVELEAAVERVRALHVGKQAFYPNWDGAVICQTCNTLFPCPTLRALEGTP